MQQHPLTDWGGKHVKQLIHSMPLVAGRGKSSSISSTMIFWNCKIIGNTIMNHVKLFFIGTNLHIKDGEP